MREVYDLLESLAGSNVSTLISGETGTGKEVASRTIHECSPRAKGPFVALNAAAVPETLIESELFGHEKGAFTGATAVRSGCFEQAHGGTLLIDEIAEMPMALQPKLLRVLEGGRFRRLGGSHEIVSDVRVVAATNREPSEAIKKGLLREDLFYRLSVFSVTLPALREHSEDIPLLAHHFLEKFHSACSVPVFGFRQEAMERLVSYSWPGNVRELRNVVERAAILAKTGWVEVSHLPSHIVKPEAIRKSERVLAAASGARGGGRI
jgi:DNA-binding NtrC family response regulator